MGLFWKRRKKASFSDRLRELAEDFRRRTGALAVAREAKDPPQAKAGEKSKFPDEDAEGSQKTIPAADAKRAAEAAFAQGLEGATKDAVESLRDLAVRLRTSSESGNGTTPPADGFSDKS